MKKTLAALLLLIFVLPLHAAGLKNTSGMTSTEITAHILGYWEAEDKEIGNTQAIVAVYEYDGKIYSRIIALYNPDTKEIEDDIYQQKNRDANIKGNPPYCGMDILFGLQHYRDARFNNGKILDPKSGKYYAATVNLLENDTLKATGHHLFFRKNLYMAKVDNTIFPKDFIIPNETTFILVIPAHK